MLVMYGLLQTHRDANVDGTSHAGDGLRVLWPLADVIMQKMPAAKSPDRGGQTGKRIRGAFMAKP